MQKLLKESNRLKEILSSNKEALLSAEGLYEGIVINISINY